MVRHIVMWKLKDGARGKTNAENAADVKAGLEGLVGKVPGLLDAEVSTGFSPDYDMCLVSTHESREALAVYQGHEEHLKVKTLVHEVVCARACCDCEMG